ncbi:hypothetical protein [Nitratireductor sp. XY-223]|uniref:hypothetical protein n=1 Tax=Nitratireductor sp. XY-223 TaxID=2561926 RepID=UPI0010AB2855|nr:hypothetical protein [Nitratireductor sp. XY-223]
MSTSEGQRHPLRLAPAQERADKANDKQPGTPSRPTVQKGKHRLLDDPFRKERGTQTMHPNDDTATARGHVQRFSGPLHRRNVTSPRTADPLALFAGSTLVRTAKVLLQQIE